MQLGIPVDLPLLDNLRPEERHQGDAALTFRFPPVLRACLRYVFHPTPVFVDQSGIGSVEEFLPSEPIRHHEDHVFGFVVVRALSSERERDGDSKYAEQITNSKSLLLTIRNADGHSAESRRKQCFRMF